MTLKARYEHGTLNGDLQDEKAWALDVRNRLEAAAASMAAPFRSRIEQNLDYALDEALALGAYAVPPPAPAAQRDA